MCAERQTENQQEGSDLERKMTKHTQKKTWPQEKEASDRYGVPCGKRL